MTKKTDTKKSSPSKPEEKLNPIAAALAKKKELENNTNPFSGGKGQGKLKTGTSHIAQNFRDFNKRNGS